MDRKKKASLRVGGSGVASFCLSLCWIARARAFVSRTLSESASFAFSRQSTQRLPSVDTTQNLLGSAVLLSASFVHVGNRIDFRLNKLI